MTRIRQYSAIAVFGILVSLVASAQSKPGVLTTEEVKKAVPATYYFRGQSASVQVRNTAGIRVADGKLILAGLVDTSGYAADVAQKYQGLLITEVKLKVGDSELVPGQYGFGFLKDGKFIVLDVGSNELFTVSSQNDQQLHRPTPLKIVEADGAYRLYAGRSYVTIKPE